VKQIALLLLAVALLIQSGRSGYEAAIDPEVDEIIRSDGHVQVIVKLKDAPLLENASGTKLDEVISPSEAILSDLDLKGDKDPMERLLGEGAFDLEIDATFEVFNGFSGNLTAQGLEALRNDPRVENVFIERLARVALDVSVPLVNASYAWENIIINGEEHSFKGEGQTVCVIDTGANYSHPALGGCTTAQFLTGDCGRILGGKDYVNSDNVPLDDQGHGTHVAGIVGSSDATYRGVAPEAGLIIMKACDNLGDCFSTPLLKSLDWCINNSATYNISVITLSLGDGDEYNSSNPCPQTFNAIFARARARNISVFVASGNEYHNQGISWPACDPNVTAIGATDDSGAVTSYSNLGPGLSLVAPGGTVTGQIRSLDHDSYGFADSSGTSMAAPHAAGAAAILHGFHLQETGHGLLPSVLSLAFNNTGSPSFDASTGRYYRLIDVGDTLESLRVYPVITFSSPTPSDAAVISADWTIINITADLPLSSAWVQWEGSNVTMEGSGTDWSINLTGDGTHSFIAFGNDTDGDIGRSEERTMFLNSTCLSPVAGLHIVGNATFCNGTFVLGNQMEIDAEGAVIDCNGSVLVGGGMKVSGQNLTLRRCSLNDGNLSMSGSSSLLIESFVLNSSVLEAVDCAGVDLSGSSFIASSLSFLRVNHSLIRNSSFPDSHIRGSSSLNMTLEQLSPVAGGSFQDVENLTIIHSSVSGTLVLSGIEGARVINDTFTGSIGLLIQGQSGGIFRNNTLNSSLFHVYLNHSSDFTFTHNRFSTLQMDAIREKIMDSEDNPALGTVTFDPWSVDPAHAQDSDADDDGYSSSLYGGPDCDDSDILINPNRIEVNDSIDNDCDDVIDEGFIVGTDLVTNLPALSVFIDGSDNLSGLKSGLLDVVFRNQTRIFVSFPFNFSAAPLNLSNVTVNSSVVNGGAGLVISGLDLAGRKKAVSVDDLNATVPGFCVLDREAALGDVSMSCNASDEQLVLCDGEEYSGYTCLSGGGQANITGLSHSVVFEMDGCTDNDGDGRGAGCLAGSDCDEDDPDVYPGASCTVACYSGSVYSASCVCQGGSYTCTSSGGGGGGGGGGAPSTPPDGSFTKSFFSLSAFIPVYIEVGGDLPVVSLNFTPSMDTTGAKVIVKRSNASAGARTRTAFNISFTGIEVSGIEVTFRFNRTQWEGNPVSLLGSSGESHPSMRWKVTEHYAYFISYIPGPGEYAALEASPPLPEPEIVIDKKTNITQIPPKKPTEAPQLELPAQAIPNAHDLTRVWFVLISFVMALLLIFVARKEMHRKKKIHQFIWQSLEQGHPEHAIHTHLVNKGVNHDHAHDHIREVSHHHNIAKMEEYVQKCLELGHDDKGILSILKEHGWHEDHVTQAIAKAKADLKQKHFPTLAHVEDYIVKRLHLGHLEEEIKKDLSRFGFSHEHITHHVKRARATHDMKRLTEFVQKKISQGTPDEKIHALLREKGWDHSLISSSIAKARSDAGLKKHFGHEEDTPDRSSGR